MKDTDTTKGWSRRARDAAKFIAINAMVLAVLLIVAECALRAVYRHYQFYSRTQPGQFADRMFGGRQWPRKDADLGWVMNSGDPDFFAPKGFVAPKYASNAQGFRDPRDFSSLDSCSGKTRVMMLGDSFLFAVHLDAEHTIPAALERRLPNVDVYNLGIPGWGLDQMYLSHRKYADAIKPDVVVLLYIDDDLLRIYEAFRKGEGMNKPSFAVDADTLVPRTTPVPESFVMRNVVGRSLLANKLYVMQRDRDIRRIAKAIFASLAADAKKRNERLLVVRLPRLNDIAKPPRPDLWSLAGFFAETGGEYVDLRSQMPNDPGLFIPEDEHLNAKGTEHVADVLSKMAILQSANVAKPGARCRASR